MNNNTSSPVTIREGVISTWTNDAQPAEAPSNEAKKRISEYFITINISPNSKLYAKHTGIYSIYHWWNLTAEEQYEYFRYILKRYIKQYNITHKLCVCYEQTMDCNIHIHFRMKTTDNMKCIKIQFFDMIFNGVKKQKGITNMMRHFINVKIFDATKWNDYFNKYKKTYQTTSYGVEHFTLDKDEKVIIEKEPLKIEGDNYKS